MSHCYPSDIDREQFKKIMETDPEGKKKQKA